MIKIKCNIDKFKNLTKGNFYQVLERKFIGDVMICLINDNNNENFWAMRCWFD